MNVLFKRGLQSALDSLVNTANSAVEGSFYLTSDTDRLYIGKNVGTVEAPDIRPVAVNQGVITVANVASLPAASDHVIGDFYYCTAENVLCVLSGKVGQKRWVQINPDTNTSIKTYTISTATNSGVTTITHNVQEQISEGGSTSDGSSFNPSVSLQGSNGVAVSNNNNAITITGEKTTISADSKTIGGKAGATVKLTSDTQDSTAHDRDSSFDIAAGTNISLGVNNGVVTINSTAPNMGTGASVTIGNGDGTQGDTEGFNISVADSAGNTATGAFDPTVQLGTHSESLYHFDNGKVTLPVYTKDEVDDKVKEFDAMHYAGTLGSTGSVNVISPGGTASAGVLTTVDIGDTFKVSGTVTSMTGTNGILKDNAGKLYGAKTNASDTTHNDIILKDGDLLIAQGTEGTDGHITSASLYFDYVPSANDTDSQYLGHTIDNGIEFNEVGTSNLIGGIQIAASTSNNCIEVTDNQNANTQGVTNTITLKHAETFGQAATYTPQGDATNGVAGNTYQQQAATGASPVKYLDIQVPTISYDKSGHITAISSVTYRVVDTYGSGSGITDLVAKTVTSTGNNSASSTYSTTATLAVQFTQPNGDADDVTMDIYSETLSMSKTATGDNLNINIVWGTF